MIIRLCVLLLVAQLSPLSFAKVIAEKEIIEITRSSSPDWQNLESQFLFIEAETGKFNDRFQGEIFVNGNYAETNERAIIQFQPIFSPIKQAQLGYRKPFQSGTQLSVSAGTDQRTAMSPFAGSFRNVTTTILQIQMQMDLWKDLFGRFTKAQLASLEFSNERAKLEKEIQQKSLVVTTRRIYWGLVANNEQVMISQNLLKAAEEQYKDAQRRFQNAVADQGEVARYEAQVASRKANLYYLEYQKEVALKQLRTIVPELSGAPVELDSYNLAKTIDEVLACTQVIAKETSIPYQYTRYDEVMELIKKTKAAELKSAALYDDIDLKFTGTVKSTGVGSNKDENLSYYRGSYGDSWDDMNQENRLGYQVGLNLVVPIGGQKGETRKTQELYQEKKYESQFIKTQTQILTTHEQLVKSIQLLAGVIKAQKENNAALTKRLKVMTQKYSQARISVTDLINDQDALLNSQLGVIQTQNQILNTIFDYLAIYTETPCEFNRI